MQKKACPNKRASLLNFQIFDYLPESTAELLGAAVTPTLLETDAAGAPATPTEASRTISTRDLHETAHKTQQITNPINAITLIFLS
jgi:hypothetical protein